MLRLNLSPLPATPLLRHSTVCSTKIASINSALVQVAASPVVDLEGQAAEGEETRAEGDSEDAVADRADRVVLVDPEGRADAVDPDLADAVAADRVDAAALPSEANA